MCNLYHVSPKGDLTTYFRALPPEGLVAGPVGPFGVGAFLRRVDGELRCTLGQWGLIRPGQPKAPEPLENASLLNAIDGTIDLNSDGTASRQRAMRHASIPPSDVPELVEGTI